MIAENGVFLNRTDILISEPLDFRTWGRRNMTKLSSYACTTCGGVLNIDSDQELLDCPFCGTRLDLVEYHRRDILSQAELCLKRMEYRSAYERYKELHDKDHKDFEALRGLILCAGKFPVKEDLTDPKRLIRHDIKRALTVLSQLNEDCSDHPYFAKLNEVLKLSFSYRNKADGRDIEERLKAACEELKSLEPAAETVTYQEKLNQTYIASEADTVSDIICIKCGGQLMMDKKRSLCECRSCGVAYGTSLFFGNANKKAKEALVNRDFSEADQRYSYMLMLDPHDFEALRGRVLCAAKWSSPKVESDISSFWVNNLRSRVEYALENALDEDKPYFEKYIEMMDVYSLVLAEDNKLKPLKRQLKDLTYKRDNIVVDYNPEEDNGPRPDFARRTISNTISDIEKKIYLAESGKKAREEKAQDICSQIREMDKDRVIRKAQSQDDSNLQ